ncbi:DUF2306 domain-containing protein [Kibdelosporangium lantanae]
MTTVSSPPVRRRRWRSAAALIVLSAVPVVAGAARVGQLAGGGPVTSDNARFFASPVPVVLHIVGASVYCVLGAFQFVPREWHRTAGRLLVPCGLVAALAGLWMAAFYPLADDVVLKSMRFTAGTAMAVSLVLGYLAVRRRDFVTHRAWMIRAYAIGLGAGTQVFTSLAWLAVAGTPGHLGVDVAMGAGWVTNIVVAELAIRRVHRRQI